MEIKEHIPVNWALISHPMNWIILFLMVVIALMAVDIIMGHFGHHKPASAETAGE